MAGRLISSTAETEWDDEERGWMLALDLLESEQCSGCGGHLPETTDPALQGSWQVPDPARCHRCTAIGMKQKTHREAGVTDYTHALKWFSHLKRR